LEKSHETIKRRRSISRIFVLGYVDVYLLHSFCACPVEETKEDMVALYLRQLAESLKKALWKFS
jgi:diketogulonate reductase-like aldo/keto reductase